MKFKIKRIFFKKMGIVLSVETWISRFYTLFFFHPSIKNWNVSNYTTLVFDDMLWTLQKIYTHLLQSPCSQPHANDAARILETIYTFCKKYPPEKFCRNNVYSMGCIYRHRPVLSGIMEVMVTWKYHKWMPCRALFERYIQLP